MTDKQCPCLIPDENDNCVECGKHIDMPDVEAPNLGDIVGIIRLIDETVRSYAEITAENSDPENPQLPRLRLIGCAIVRIPHKAFYKELFEPTYQRAKALGYRGSLQRWGELLQEAVEHPNQPAL